MRLLVLSDLHLDIWRGHHPKTDLAACKPDVVILAGDIHGGAKAVPWAAETFSDIPVLYVHGNHESYGYTLEDIQADIAQQSICTKNVLFLDAAHWADIDGVRFLGCTLWTNFCLFGIEKRTAAMSEAERYMNDYRAIDVQYENGMRKLKAFDTLGFHAKQRAWLQDRFDEKFEGKTVVITHMAPSFSSVPDQFKDDIVSAAYASNLDELTTFADLWIHGHTHDSFDYKIGDCRVVCNPCGYPTRGGNVENELFNPNLIIEI